MGPSLPLALGLPGKCIGYRDTLRRYDTLNDTRNDNTQHNHTESHAQQTPHNAEYRNKSIIQIVIILNSVSPNAVMSKIS
jgi:hypothetical protein